MPWIKILGYLVKTAAYRIVGATLVATVACKHAPTHQAKSPGP
jgi:hypothetical protein